MGTAYQDLERVSKRCTAHVANHGTGNQTQVHQTTNDPGGSVQPSNDTISARREFVQSYPAVRIDHSLGAFVGS